MSSSPKIMEQYLKLVQHNFNMSTQWLDYTRANLKKAQDFSQKIANFQIKQLEKLQEYANNTENTSLAPPLFSAWQRYLVDYTQRRIIFLDILRKRGNQYVEHIEAGSPPVLIFKYETIVDGRTLEHPVNYALVTITPPKGVVVDDTKRPYLIIDPRAGHGAGIGGFKDDSQVGVALRAGHPVYFVIFFPDPVPNQTLHDVAIAEKIFSEAVVARHPHSPKPCIIGNCQAGWAVMMLAAAVPDLAGALVINGAPLSYWAGENGKNPLRYMGGMVGGSWPAQFASDVGNGRFDGANLVMNFESLNPANTYWVKYYQLFANIDHEEKRFLDFERWWGGFYLMNADEIRGIVDNLFIGNYLTHGKIPINQNNYLDLRKIRSPIIIFCSEGDNITPPQQALNWITDIYKNELEIKAAEQTIIYLVHRYVGHLGIFVSGSVATKEHSEIVDLLGYVEILPPGLYEMIIHENPHSAPGKSRYQVILEERTINDILDRSDHDKNENKNIFRTVRSISKFNSMAYDLCAGWLMRALSSEPQAEFMRQLHPLRMSRYLISDYNPLIKPIAAIAEVARVHRQPVEEDNPFLEMQNDFSDLVTTWLDNYRERRDNRMELTFYSIYGMLAIILEDVLKRETRKREVNLKEAPQELISLEKSMMEGDEIDAVIRIMLLIVKAQGFVQGSRVANIRELLGKSLNLSRTNAPEVREKIRKQTLLVAQNPEQAVLTLSHLLPTKQSRQFVLKTLHDLLKQAPLLSPKAEQMWENIEKILMAENSSKKTLTTTQKSTKTKPKKRNDI